MISHEGSQTCEEGTCVVCSSTEMNAVLDSAQEQASSVNPPSPSIQSPYQATIPLCEKDSLLRKGKCKGNKISPDTIRDIIIGLTDGLTVPFALTAGLSGVGSSRLVMLAGVAELISGSISMGIGGYLSAKAELDHYRHQMKMTCKQVNSSCGKALLDDLAEIFEPYGVPSELTAALSTRLKEAELSSSSQSMSLKISRHSQLRSWIKLKSGMIHESEKTGAKGLTPFMVQFGQGLEPIASSRAYASAFTIGISYILGGMIPLLPYIVIHNVQTALFVSIGITGLMLIAFGAVKQHFIGIPAGIQSYLWGALSTLAIGGIAAAASWGIVHGIESNLHSNT